MLTVIIALQNSEQEGPDAVAGGDAETLMGNVREHDSIVKFIYVLAVRITTRFRNLEDLKFLQMISACNAVDGDHGVKVSNMVKFVAGPMERWFGEVATESKKVDRFSLVAEWHSLDVPRELALRFVEAVCWRGHNDLLRCVLREFRLSAEVLTSGERGGWARID